MSVTAHMQRDVEMRETKENPPVLALGLCPDGGVEDQVPAMRCQSWADIMQVSATRTPLDTNSLGSTGLSKVSIASLTAAFRCAHRACQQYFTK